MVRPFVFETHNVPCKTNPLGVKGAGEAGAIGSCPAVVNAIIEGLWREYKIDHIDMPATAGAGLDRDPRTPAPAQPVIFAAGAGMKRHAAVLHE